jgi:hypothetical protein
MHKKTPVVLIRRVLSKSAHEVSSRTFRSPLTPAKLLCDSLGRMVGNIDSHGEETYAA